MYPISTCFVEDKEFLPEKILLSIIIPVYNVQDYIEQCLVSLVSDFKNFDSSRVEIIVVNDGSIDDSLSVIERCRINFPFLKIFSKDNGGLSDARNFGLRHANGQYISFIDSDDVVDVKFIRVILECIKNYSFDVLSFDFEKFFKIPPPQAEQKTLQLNIRKVELSFYEDQAIFAWNKIYSRDLIINERFLKGLYYEDVALIPIILSRASKRMHLSRVCYYYRQRMGAITFYQDDKYLDILQGLTYVRSRSQNQYIDSFTINQFFTLCLISLRRPFRQYLSNMTIITKYYLDNFNISNLKPRLKFKHLPFFLLKYVGKTSIILLLLIKPAVLLHHILKNIKGKKNAEI